MRGGVLCLIFVNENYRFVRLASVACYQAVDWQVGNDEIQGVVLYMQSCPVLLETARKGDVFNQGGGVACIARSAVLIACVFTVSLAS